MFLIPFLKLSVFFWKEHDRRKTLQRHLVHLCKIPQHSHAVLFCASAQNQNWQRCFFFKLWWQHTLTTLWRKRYGNKSWFSKAKQGRFLSLLWSFGPSKNCFNPKIVDVVFSGQLLLCSFKSSEISFCFLSFDFKFKKNFEAEQARAFPSTGLLMLRPQLMPQLQDDSRTT